MTLWRRSAPSARSAPRVVVDTNIWVSGLITPDGPPGQVIEAARRKTITVVASWELADEVKTVLTRPKFTTRYDVTVGQLMELLGLMGPLLPRVDIDLDVDIRDRADVPVVTAAITRRAQFIVTGDDDLFDMPIRGWLADRDIAVVTARDLLGLIADRT